MSNGLNELLIPKKERGYLRLRYSLYPSMSFTNLNPFSMSFIASYLLFVALHVHSCMQHMYACALES